MKGQRYLVVQPLSAGYGEVIACYRTRPYALGAGRVMCLHNAYVEPGATVKYNGRMVTEVFK